MSTRIRLVMLGLVVLTSASSLATSLASEYCHQQIVSLASKLQREMLDMCLPAGVLTGCLLSWLPLRFLGRRATLQLVVAPLLSAGCCLSFVFQNVMLPIMLFAIWLQGAAVGVNFTAVPVYVLETIRIYLTWTRVLRLMWSHLQHEDATTSVAKHVSMSGRPALSLIISTQTSAAVGKLLAHLFPLTPHTSYQPLIPFAIISVSAFCLCFVMESPRWLLLFGKRIEQAKSSLHILHRCSEPDYNVCKALVFYREEEEKFSDRTAHMKVVKTYLCGLVLSMFLMIMPCICGVQAYDFYSDWVYKHAGIKTIMLGSCEQTAGVIIATVLIFATGGMRLQYVSLIISVSTISITLGATALCLYSLEQGENWIWVVPWFPLALHWTFQLTFWFGIGSQAFIVAFQSVPAPIRPSVLSLSGGLHWLLQAMSHKFLVFMLDAMQPFGTFFFHAIVSTVILVLIVFVFIPMMNQERMCSDLELTQEKVSREAYEISADKQQN